MTNADALAQLKRSLVENAGGHLRNTLHIPGETCERCRGTRMRDGYRICYPSEFNYPGAADRVGSIIYGVDGLQSGKMMFGYKRIPAIPPLVQRVTALIAIALTEHTACAETLAGVKIAGWASVPSLTRLGTEHPLRKILDEVHLPGIEIAVTASKLAREATVHAKRSHSPALYQVRTDVPQEGHVLLLEDTWASGAHSQSVATALKQTGAVSVSILTVARWLDWNERTSRIYRQYIDPRPFNPDTCPWTGGKCPP